MLLPIPLIQDLAPLLKRERVILQHNLAVYSRNPVNRLTAIKVRTRLPFARNTRHRVVHRALRATAGGKIDISDKKLPRGAARQSGSTIPDVRKSASCFVSLSLP